MRKPMRDQSASVERAKRRKVGKQIFAKRYMVDRDEIKEACAALDRRKAEIAAMLAAQHAADE